MDETKGTEYRSQRLKVLFCLFMYKETNSRGKRYENPTSGKEVDIVSTSDSEIL